MNVFMGILNFYQYKNYELGQISHTGPFKKGTVSPKSFTERCEKLILPVNSRALYAEGDAQVDAGPAGIWLAAVAAAAVSWDGQDLLQGALPLQRPFLGLAARVQASCRRGRLPVQLLT